VLVVENEPAVRDVAARALRAAGYSVLLAADGADALREAERCRGPIHLLLTDLVMPRLGGGPLAQRLVAARPGLRVVYMSGYADNAIAGREALAGGAHFLAKPFPATRRGRQVRSVRDDAQLAPR
jgi:CheY-like chemotaxis protein